MIIYDNGGKTWDRYTVIPEPLQTEMKDVVLCLGLSDDPTTAVGYSQWGACKIGKHLGRKIKLENLPEHVQKHIKERLA